MKFAHAALLATACALTALALPAQQKRLTVEQALSAAEAGGVEYYTPPPTAGWAPDGVHCVMRRDDKTVLVDPETGAVTAAPADVEPPPEPQGRRRQRPAPPSPLRIVDGDLYLGEPGERDRKKLTALTTDDTPKREAHLSPDGKRASFVRGTDLSIVDVADKSEWKVTTDGSQDLMYGVLDWVYQEEIYGRGDFQGHWWSGDGRAVAFLRLDESKVKPFTVIDHVPTGALTTERAVVAEVTKYPKAGDPNPTAGLLVAWPGKRKVIEVDLDGYDDDVLIVRVGWTPDDTKVLFAVQDRIQTWLDLLTADPATGEVTKLLRETSETWTNRLPFPRWLDDGSFLWLSERTGYQHIYHYTGAEHRALTAGEWQVREIAEVAEQDGRVWVWFTGTRDGAIDNNLYRVGLDGQDLTRLTQGDGWHETEVRKDGRYFLDTVSAVQSPPELRLCKGDGRAFDVLGRATPKDVEKIVLCPTELFVIEARDGYPLDATLIRPPDFDPSRRYPIYLPTYSGPDAPTVRDAFQPSAWNQLIAQHGALVLQVNVRSASGRGLAHTGLAYKRLGVLELRDLEDAVDHVVGHESGDPHRVAIDGWSYGGFMAAYALTHSDKFSLGLAGGGVHDWRLYDTIYTERYMSTPDKNPEGYRETSVIGAVNDLHGHLVLMHGVMDDNVHVQNTLQLVYALQRAGKDDFELMLYPKSRHGVRSPHRRRMLWRVLRDQLGLGAVR